VWLGHDDNTDTGLTGATGALRVWATLMKELDITPRQITQPAEIQWEQVPARPVADAGRRDCNEAMSLPFHDARLPSVDYTCEVNESFFDRVLDRFRSLGQ